MIEKDLEKYDNFKSFYNHFSSDNYFIMVMEGAPSPQCVGREFVRQYYTLLNKAPEFLHRFVCGLYIGILSKFHWKRLPTVIFP